MNRENDLREIAKHEGIIKSERLRVHVYENYLSGLSKDAQGTKLIHNWIKDSKNMIGASERLIEIVKKILIIKGEKTIDKKQQFKKDFIETFYYDIFMDEPKAKEDVTNEEIECCNNEVGLSIKDIYIYGNIRITKRIIKHL